MFPSVNLADPVNRGHVLNRGLRAWWFVVPGLYGGSQLADLLGKRHGVRNAGLTPTAWAQANRPGGYGSLHFPGGRYSYIACPSPDLPASPALTVSGWFKTTASGGAGLNHILAWGGTALGGNAYRITIESGSLWLRVHSGASNWGTGLADGKWHHFVLSTPAGGRLNNTICYIDGKSFGAGSNTQFIRPTNTQIHIGQDLTVSSVTSAFAGQIDDIRIANAYFRSDGARALYSLSRQYYPGLLERTRRRLVVVSGGEEPVPIAANASDALQPIIVEPATASTIFLSTTGEIAATLQVEAAASATTFNAVCYDIAVQPEVETSTATTSSSAVCHDIASQAEVSSATASAGQQAVAVSTALPIEIQSATVTVSFTAACHDVIIQPKVELAEATVVESEQAVASDITLPVSVESASAVTAFTAACFDIALPLSVFSVDSVPPIGPGQYFALRAGDQDYLLRT